MTYFHTGNPHYHRRKSFHGPVRDGKGWDRLAMVIRQTGVVVMVLSASVGCRSRIGCEVYLARMR